ncbi:adaptin N terminal region-domain-containing protein [Cantharellus anzutake]|uniref:adaptin N terminal region-domain-containing protein n=1 Tax=Cantharellus anzutake TaxID=1750568 RepID=UPI001908E2F8|nr:adaptin N terminal region-domain-containing protein [Cantharellus anzutake]KAF8330859.1 adaptin N terminal region-domain-containing protein [Cantharellus anzutake]
MFERTLSDLIKGLRATDKKDEAKFIALAVNEIRKEIKGGDMELKAATLLKLVYLEMLGYDMSWASFHVVEVMSSPRFHLKSVGYLAAVQSFKEGTEVLMLTTNTLKKDIGSPHPHEISVALDGLSHIATTDIGRDVSNDLIGMLNHSRPRIRKRAVLAVYKVSIKYPEILVHGIPRLQEKLHDPDDGVVSATANVLCELAGRRPHDYLALAPHLFEILTASSNNWMLIKIIKLFGALAPHEPRLAKKLQRPMTELISMTPAVSLLYECVRTCIVGNMLEGTAGNNLAKLCVQKLSAFLKDEDQNLKYIALLALAKIVPSHPHLVAAHENEILLSLEDEDMSIRVRCLELMSSMVTDYNLQSIVQQLLQHLVAKENSSTSLQSAAKSLARTAAASAEHGLSRQHIAASYRLEVAKRVVEMCSRNTYENITDFHWYLSVLIDLAYVSNVGGIGAFIRDQLVDVVVRVKSPETRKFATELMIKLLGDDGLLENCNDETSCSEILWAAAWICGEYPQYLSDPIGTLKLLFKQQVSRLPGEIIAVYLQATLKIFGHWAAELSKQWREDSLSEAQKQVDQMLSSITLFISSDNVEVQERATNIQQLFTFIKADFSKHAERPAQMSKRLDTSEPEYPKSLYLIRPLHARELKAVARNAQASVQVPIGLDIDAWIVHPSRLKELASDPTASGSEGETQDTPLRTRRKGKGRADGSKSKGSRRKGVQAKEDAETVDSLRNVPLMKE